MAGLRFTENSGATTNEDANVVCIDALDADSPIVDEDALRAYPLIAYNKDDAEDVITYSFVQLGRTSVDKGVPLVCIKVERGFANDQLCADLDAMVVDHIGALVESQRVLDAINPSLEAGRVTADPRGIKNSMLAGFFIVSA